MTSTLKLSDRLQRARDSAATTTTRTGTSRVLVPRPAGDKAASDPFGPLKQRVQESLFERLGLRLYDPALTEEQLNVEVMAELNVIMDAEPTPLSPSERRRLGDDVRRDILGYGPIEELLTDPTVSEVMVNGVSSIYYERAGRLHRSENRFVSEQHLRRVIDRIVSQIGRRVDESTPMVDARLPDGSRVNAVIPPAAVDGAALTVRKFSSKPLQVDDLIRFGTLTREMADLLDACVRGRLNVIVSGGTGTGKTTLLNVLSSSIPSDERILTIEDAVELQLRQDHVIRLETRPPNVENRGSITIRDLVRNALRMRPDRIVIGECRGGEALDMLQAMNTGHDGSLSTVHANTPRDALARLETMVLMAGMDLPARAIREQITAAVDLIVQVSRLRDGTRRITHVTEVTGMEGEVTTLQDIFLFDFAKGVDADGHFLGSAVPTGVRPQFAEKLEHMGIHIAPSVFGLGAPIRGRVR